MKRYQVNRIRRYMIRTIQMLFLMVVVLSIPLSNTLAKYVTSDSNENTARVAGWSIAFNANGQSVYNSGSIPFVAASTNVVDALGNPIGRATELIPGMSGLFAMQVSNQSEVIAIMNNLQIKVGFAGEALGSESLEYWESRLNSFAVGFSMKFYLSADENLDTNDTGAISYFYDTELPFTINNLDFSLSIVDGVPTMEANLKVVGSDSIDYGVSTILPINEYFYILVDWKWTDAGTSELQTIHNNYENYENKLCTHTVTQITTEGGAMAYRIVYGAERNYLSYQAYLIDKYTSDDRVLFDLDLDGIAETLFSAISVDQAETIISYEEFADIDFFLYTNNTESTEAIIKARKSKLYLDYSAYLKYLSMGDYSSYIVEEVNGVLECVETHYDSFYDYLRWLWGQENGTPNFYTAREGHYISYENLTYNEKYAINNYDINNCTIYEKADYYNLYFYEKCLTNEFYYFVEGWGEWSDNAIYDSTSNTYSAGRFFNLSGYGISYREFMTEVYKYYQTQTDLLGQEVNSIVYAVVISASNDNEAINRFSSTVGFSFELSHNALNTAQDGSTKERPSQNVIYLQKFVDGVNTDYCAWMTYEQLWTTLVTGFNSPSMTAYYHIFRKVQEEINYNNQVGAPSGPIRVCDIDVSNQVSYPKFHSQNLEMQEVIICLKQRAALKAQMAFKYYNSTSFFSSKVVDRTGVDEIDIDYVGGYFEYVLYLSSIGGLPQFSVLNSQTNSYDTKWYSELTQEDINTIIGYYDEREFYYEKKAIYDNTENSLAIRNQALIDAETHLDKVIMFYDLIQYRQFIRLKTNYEKNIEFANLGLNPYFKFLPTIEQVD